MSEEDGFPEIRNENQGKWKRYSGLFALLKQKWSVSVQDWERVVGKALAIFTAIVLPVPTRV
ncbi:MAG: hypothetical protein RMK65_05225 [Anaerolineae bacterium]|nr:hypothetical protein [Anaerolineae bacterium]MDW8068649.1 hypothetical protein [Anaerolineae bacterium]